ncbi:MAG: L-histidine N(alpha)-methyltransferase, partial [Burkholderiaceae bacterium]|nr:L-histidine N(alpha)-methyltransferase [Burkholderiaceae bacterium]
MKTPRFIQLHRIDDAALADEAAAGLQARPAQVSPKFFYDPLGSRLFDAITELDEYYPTRTEAAILAT